MVKFKNQRICLHCDNEAVVFMINDTTSRCKQCMTLLRLITMEAMVLNVKVSARHVDTKANGKANALSRLDMKRFRKLGPKMDLHPSAIPDEIWPLNKVWLK